MCTRRRSAVELSWLAVAFLAPFVAWGCGGVASGSISAGGDAGDSVGKDGGIQRSDSGGTQGSTGGAWIWQGTAGLTGATLNAVWASSGRDAWAVGDVTAHWDGVKWQKVDSGTNERLYGVWGASSDDVWAVGASGVEGVITHFDGSGWNVSIVSDSVGFTSVSGTGMGDVWAVGGDIYPSFSDSTISHFTGSWTPVVSHDGTTGLNGVWASSPADAWVVSGVGNMLHWDGSAWSPVADMKLANMRGIWGSSASDVWAVGTGIVHYDGTGWVNYASRGALLNAVGGADASDVWATGSNGTILRFDPTKSGPVTCEEIGATCGPSSACGIGTGYLTDYPCAASGSSCCVPLSACGGAPTITCCNASGAPAPPPQCLTGTLTCVGSIQCPSMEHPEG
jgi:hypothetical protein